MFVFLLNEYLGEKLLAYMKYIHSALEETVKHFSKVVV